MAKEIERKFLLKTIPPEIAHRDSQLVYQSYLPGDYHPVRVRIIDGARAFLTVKGERENFTRDEEETQIPVKAAKMLLGAFHTPLIIKTRYIIYYDNIMWTIDHIHTPDDEDVWLAEVELSSEDQELSIPDWVANEVTHDKNYYNEVIASRTFEGD
jgi:adenylate cyclase